MGNVKYWIWLASLRGLSNRNKLELLSRYETPERLYYSDDPELMQIAALQNRSLKEADRILGDCEKEHIELLAYGDANYPNRLMNIYDPPLVLYYKGRMPIFDDEVAIGVVGTRMCTPYGQKAAEDLSYRITRQGGLIVSGLAKGIDGFAHTGALRAGGVTAAVLGCGLDIIYPNDHKSLYEDIVATGVVLSEYAPGTPPDGRNFPARNRIISGLSLGVLVVEAPLKSGALITAATAIDQGRDVFAVPGPIYSGNSAGTNHLLRDGAILVTDSWDVLGEYVNQYPHKLTNQETRHIRPTERRSSSTTPVVTEQAEPEEETESMPILDFSRDLGLTDDQMSILRCLTKEMQVDDIIETTQIPARRVLSALTLLEIDGYVAQSAGKRFSRLVAISE